MKEKQRQLKGVEGREGRGRPILDQFYNYISFIN